MPGMAIAPPLVATRIDGMASPIQTKQRYLEMLNLFRILACLVVVSQHAFIWTGMSTNVVGSGFIAMLHLSRNAFFFLTGLVVCYSQIVHPRTRNDFWKRRYLELGVPYLTWTAIYLVFNLITIGVTWEELGVYLRHNLILGYSQMYAVFVIFQFYLVFPFLLRVIQKINRPFIVMSTSAIFATIVSIALHYPSWFPPITHVIHWANRWVPSGRDFFVYQVFFVAGMLVAVHIDEVLTFVSRHYRGILASTVAVGLLMVSWYGFQVADGGNVARASDDYEPQAVLWCLAAVAGLFTLSFLWDRRVQRSASISTRNSGRLVAYGAGITGGFFFAHNIFLTMTRAFLNHIGLTNHLSWEVEVPLLLVVTIMLTVPFVALVLRTPLRWVLGGPDRSLQRASYPSADVDLSPTKKTAFHPYR
jgi:peptidoglycan/LPS O-acetylase OafA/YrhL